MGLCGPAITAVLNFYTNGAGWQGDGDESFGLDNVVVQADGTTVPELFTMIFFGSGLIGLLGFRQKMRK